MSDTLITALHDRGMTVNEAKIYLTALELGSSPASTIARRAGVKRVTGYAILRDFVTKGIASRLEKSGVSYFHVIDPKKLLGQLQSKVSAFEQVVPQLLAMTDSYSNKPKIEYFEGVQGIQEMYEDLLTSQTEICAFLGMEEMPEGLRDYLVEDFLPRRIGAGVSARVILPPSPTNQHYVGLDTSSLKESIMIDNSIYDFVGEINLYGPNKVMFASLSESELSGMIFHSAKMYYSMQHIFDLVRNTHH